MTFNDLTDDQVYRIIRKRMNMVRKTIRVRRAKVRRARASLADLLAASKYKSYV